MSGPSTPSRSVSARVWAPTAEHVDLVRGQTGPSSPMTRTDGGWWEAPGLQLGADYWFSPDGRGPFPDPRSRWQPFGVDGPSRLWEPDPDHHWAPSPDREVLGGPIYELHVGTFTSEGGLRSAAAHLADLVDLGVETVELMPIAQFSGEFGWGYDGVDLFAVHRSYGGPDALVEFVDRAHEIGLSVCVDVVLNHLGAWGNYLSQLAPYYSERHQTPWGPGFDLDGPDSLEPRAFLLDVCRHWLVDLHVDALRLDAVHALQDDSPRHLLDELADRVATWREETGRRLALIAESDLNDPRMVTPRADGGVGMDAQWADDVHHALFVALTGETQGYYADFADPDALVHVLQDVFFHDGRWSAFRGRTWGSPVPPDLDRRRFVAYSQNHDQVGNRARGDRPSETLDDAQLAAAAALVLLSSTTPMVFQGEEWGTRTPFRFFSDQETEDRARIVRTGREAEFGRHGWDGQVPDPTSRDTFEACVLDWSERDQPGPRRMLAWYRRLLEVRRTAPGVRGGSRQRASQEGPVVRIANAGVLVVADLSGHALPSGPDGPGQVVAAFPSLVEQGDAVRVLVGVGGDGGQH